MEIGNDKGFVFIGGSCSIENREHALYMARSISTICEARGIPFIYKSSFDKANRTSGDSPRGVGLDVGLGILMEIRESLGIETLTDFHETQELDVLEDYYFDAVDVVQIPAFLCRQTNLLIRAGKTGKTINLKKGQFASGKDMKYAIDKVRSTGNNQIWVTERGNTFGYSDLVVDYRNLIRLRALGIPVIFDAGHSAQKPGALDGKSGGDRSLIPPLAAAAMAIGVAGLFCEVHDNPEQALSDGPNSLRLSDLPAFLDRMKAIDTLIKENS